ncbi:MAG: winged helix DNA-binding domain-containing protein, partial [Caldilineaceae bacterium]
MTHIESALELSWAQASRARVIGSGLVTPFASPEEAAARLVGVQAQIEPAAGIALWNRTKGFSATKLDTRLYTQRTLIKLWGQRHTLHLYPAADWPLLHAARAINLTWWERQAADPKYSLEDYRHKVDEIAALLRTRPTLGRNDLRALDLDLHEDLFSGWGGIFADLVRLGYACHAGREGSEGRFAHREVWLPDLTWNPPDADTANIELARRFFTAYAPATVDDFAYWRACTQKQARAWVAALGSELATVRVAGRPMLVATAQLDALALLPAGRAALDGLPLRMLFRFDPLLLGHRDK